MGALLPDSSSGVFWHLLLPRNLGGLDMWTYEDLPLLVSRLPNPTKWLIKRLATNPDSIQPTELEEFQRFTSNCTYRGYKLLKSDEDFITDLMRTHFKSSEYVKRYKFNELYSLLGYTEDEISQKSLASRAKSKGLLQMWEIEERVRRPFLFKEILNGEAKVQAFNTETFKRRYAKLWDLYDPGEMISITLEELSKAMNFRLDSPYYDTSEQYYPIDCYYNRLPNNYRRLGLKPFKVLTMLEDFVRGLPTLSITPDLIGTMDRRNLPVRKTYCAGEYV